MIKSILKLSVLSISIVSTVAPALAREFRYTATIKISDIDLRTGAGVRQAHRRIYQAAIKACTGYDQPQVCERDAYDLAQPKLRRAIRDARADVKVASAGKAE